MLKENLKRHWNANRHYYVGFGAFAGLVTFTALIMRNQSDPHISSSISGTADRSISVVGESVKIENSTLSTVSYFYADRQGPPSWVVRHLETGEVYTSQRKAANATGIPQSRLSTHLNDKASDANGQHFERLCLAVQ